MCRIRRLHQFHNINDNFLSIQSRKSIAAFQRWTERLMLLAATVYQLNRKKRRRLIIAKNTGGDLWPKHTSSFTTLLVNRPKRYCNIKRFLYTQRFLPRLNFLIRWNFLHSILLILFILTPCVFTFEYSKNVKTPTFNAEERVLLRKTFLNKFGLSHLEGQKRIGNSITKVPDYLWNLYKKLKQRRVEFTTIRHFGIYSLHFLDNGCALLTFNLSTAAKQQESEFISYGELRLPNWKTALAVNLANTKNSNSSHVYNNRTDFEKRPWVDLDAEMFTVVYNNPYLLDLLLYFPKELTLKNVEYMLRASALLIYAVDKNSVLVSKFNVHHVRKSRNRIKRSLIEEKSDNNESSKFEEDADASRNTNQQKRRRSSHQIQMTQQKQHRHRQHSSGSLCRRVDLYVDFGQLNWQDWIVAPSGYAAYQCKGRCSHPLPSNLNSSNHAIMQSLLHSIDPGAALTPSCVPVKMSPITILYRDSNNNALVVKAYADMRVDACGCQ